MPLRRLAALAALAALALAAPPAGAAPADVVARDVSADTGLRAFGLTWGAAVADFDGNGWDDAFVGRHYESFPILFANDGGLFTDRTDEAFPTHPRHRDFHDCTTADVDGNARLDVYCTHGGGKGGVGDHPNGLWLQSPAGTFSQQAEEWGVDDPWGRGRDASFLDADGDEWPDLYVTNQFPRRDGRRGANQLFLNEGGTGFRRAPEFGLNVRNGAVTVQPADLDADGDDDLLVCGQRGLRLYRNVRGAEFRDVTDRVAPAGTCHDAALAPLNRGPRPDLVLARGEEVMVFPQSSAGGFRDRPAFSRELRRARRVAVADASGDNRPDVYVLRSGRFDPDRPADRQVDRADALLLNDGTGREFDGIRLPPLRRGIGESVTPIDHDRNGLSDFIVANGKLKAEGPVRLIGLFERSG